MPTAAFTAPLPLRPPTRADLNSRPGKASAPSRPCQPRAIASAATVIPAAARARAHAQRVARTRRRTQGVLPEVVQVARKEDGQEPVGSGRDGGAGGGGGGGGVGAEDSRRVRKPPRTEREVADDWQRAGAKAGAAGMKEVECGERFRIEGQAGIGLEKEILGSAEDVGHGLGVGVDLSLFGRRPLRALPPVGEANVERFVLGGDTVWDGQEWEPGPLIAEAESQPFLLPSARMKDMDGSGLGAGKTHVLPMTKAAAELVFADVPRWESHDRKDSSSMKEGKETAVKDNTCASRENIPHSVSPPDVAQQELFEPAEGHTIASDSSAFQAEKVREYSKLVVLPPRLPNMEAAFSQISQEGSRSNASESLKVAEKREIDDCVVLPPKLPHVEKLFALSNPKKEVSTYGRRLNERITLPPKLPNMETLLSKDSPKQQCLEKDARNNRVSFTSDLPAMQHVVPPFRFQGEFVSNLTRNGGSQNTQQKFSSLEFPTPSAVQRWKKSKKFSRSKPDADKNIMLHVEIVPPETKSSLVARHRGVPASRTETGAHNGSSEFSSNWPRAKPIAFATRNEKAIDVEALHLPALHSCVVLPPILPNLQFARSPARFARPAIATFGLHKRVAFPPRLPGCRFVQSIPLRTMTPISLGRPPASMGHGLGYSGPRLPSNSPATNQLKEGTFQSSNVVSGSKLIGVDSNANVTDLVGATPIEKEFISGPACSLRPLSKFPSALRIAQSSGQLATFRSGKKDRASFPSCKNKGPQSPNVKVALGLLVLAYLVSSRGSSLPGATRRTCTTVVLLRIARYALHAIVKKDAKVELSRV